MLRREFLVSENVLRVVLIKSKLPQVKLFCKDFKSLINGTQIKLFTMATCEKAMIIPFLPIGVGKFNYHVCGKCLYFQEKGWREEKKCLFFISF